MAKSSWTPEHYTHMIVQNHELITASWFQDYRQMLEAGSGDLLPFSHKNK